MKCPFCGTLDNKVIDSRLSSAGEVTRRRRECEGCARRYTTYERVEPVSLVIVNLVYSKTLFGRPSLRAHSLLSTAS